MPVVLCAGMFMVLLDTTIVKIDVPSIIEGLDTSLDEILWGLDAYVLVFVLRAALSCLAVERRKETGEKAAV